MLVYCYYTITKPSRNGFTLKLALLTQPIVILHQIDCIDYFLFPRKPKKLKP